ncbi:MAG TPA: LodA/GoxA family CTQ-dependent oxidase [Mycobacteriales bacterium]|jgi:hypothetical protein|nr:LodA/GoxA family CTQ-dependent oxidase [Mycobacteriales bacterium]
MSDIVYCGIHPGIGIARVGDSPDEYFVGPEQPGRADAPAGRYKDHRGHVKRQAARFRVFGYDADGTVVRELTDEDAEIVWTVHLANRKAAAPKFHPDRKGERRNAAVPETRRDTLVIDPGEREIRGRGARGPGHHFDTGTFVGEPVELGELRTDEAGRLLVLGGHGTSGSPRDAPLYDFADNDGWHDDTSDGPVTVRVTLRDGGAEIPVRASSWVVVAPPDFAPSISNLVTLYDALEDELARMAAPDPGALPPVGDVCFERDIRPVLARATRYQWVNATAVRGHRATRGAVNGTVERRGDFFEPDHYALLRSTDGDDAAAARRRVFGLVRDPTAEPDSPRAKEQASPRYMPQLSGDEGVATPGEPSTWLTVTRLQYARLSKWAEGDFRVEDTAAPAEESDRSPQAVVAGLDRAALEACVGGPFFPGIEMSTRWREQLDPATPFRLASGLGAGDLTATMAVPWQADFADCRHFWWPAQRPDDVITDEDFDAVTTGRHPSGGQDPRPLSTTAFPRKRWDRGVGDQISPALEREQRVDLRHREMVREWSTLGFVVPREAHDHSEVWVETERGAYTGLRDRDYFHIMLNPGRYPDFLPVAWKLAKGFLGAGHDAQDTVDLDSDLRFFGYDELAFDARLDSIYDDLVDVVRGYDPERDQTCQSRDDVVERLRQFSPTNRTDGVWLRNVATVGPIDELTGFLAQIWIDEVGGGDPAQNHANIYTALLGSVGIPTPPLGSREYAYDDTLLESAFTAPLLQLVVSQFTEDFFPEILGMTLYLEWESVELANTARLLRHYKLDPGYYTLHVAIDNAEAGHGSLAKRAVKRYLASFHDEAQKQAQWRRIWDGYVAFRTTGTVGDDLKHKLRSELHASRRVLEMIGQKRRYGSLNHGQLAPTSGMSNNLFDDPAQMLEELVARGHVVPGDPGRSPFLQAFDFGGRMYKVFTDREQRLWEDWIRAIPQEEAEKAAADAAPAPTAVAAKPWIQVPAPGPAPAVRPHVRHLLLSSPAEHFDGHPRHGRLMGQASVH